MLTKLQETAGVEELIVKNGGNGSVVSKIETRGTLAKGAAGRVSEVAKRVRNRVSAAEVKAQLEAQLQAAYEKALATPSTEVAEPLYWWDLFAIGPIQPPALLSPPAPLTPGPLLPHQVIRVGEQAFIATILVLNPFPVPGSTPPTPADILSNFGLPYRVEYHTCNLSHCEEGPDNLNVVHEGNLVPGQIFYVDVLEFTATEEGCIFETNICARILGCEGITAPPFAGFARLTIDIDPDLFFPAPGVQFDFPIRFMVYE
jgi:hypothetical protein